MIVRIVNINAMKYCQIMAAFCLKFVKNFSNISLWGNTIIYENFFLDFYLFSLNFAFYKDFFKNSFFEFSVFLKKIKFFILKLAVPKRRNSAVEYGNSVDGKRKGYKKTEIQNQQKRGIFLNYGNLKKNQIFL